VYKENLMWKDNQGKNQDQLEFIKQIQKHRGSESHNIRILSKTEIYNIERDLSYWNRFSNEAYRKIEEEWMACIKI
jgi:hypothetical protein